MAYLEQMKIIHKDLAARNVMLTEFKRAKVGDFGLSKPDDDDDGSDQFPLNWSAPEVVINRKPVLKSDVWSFGKQILSCSGALILIVRHYYVGNILIWRQTIW